ncbi:HAMP domain-containing sensor histidine kinase [Gracilibacillus sp. S3-1-1]|uniref:HAMP domain-containing sensor histidine kinase n=1 Tax=Gracilibacillus pellucidus TaxID=3095368 RepID=A0ACC6M0I7_9BACI|nr:HAMP domain-containing sensor histidine kinase [Gracilibacillus sp. S3-1-1]MDX8044444.1 HAMP domain-containing sensor histidine kinase [Gracilibacillus sp. S3-1-1]
MGKLSRFRKRTLRGQLISYFHLTLLLSILATLITWGIAFVAFLWLINTDKINPANYYEEMIPELAAWIQEKGDVLSEEHKVDLDDMIPLDGLDYQIVNLDGEVVYGSMAEQYISTTERLENQINTNIYDKQGIIYYYPIYNDEQVMNGAVGFRYQVKLQSSNPKMTLLIAIFGGLMFLSPFGYFYLFSYLFGKRFSKNIEKPFNDIIEGAHRIQHNDLDFSLSHIDSTVELNHLVDAFEKMKEALKASLYKQWDLEQERKDMIAAIAHDLKTPLTIILGHVEGLLESRQTNPERMERYLKTIQASAERSIQLMKDLNEVSTIEQVDFRLEFTSVNIKEWLESKATEYMLLCEEKQITFQYNIKNLEKETVLIDLFRINQVLDNVLINSLRFTPKQGKINWQINITKEDIVFEVLDNGPGFADNNTTRIFEKFYQEDPSRSKSDHSGLGLFIAKTIVEKHGGYIIASNRPEGGAYIKIEIKNIE